MSQMQSSNLAIKKFKILLKEEMKNRIKKFAVTYKVFWFVNLRIYCYFSHALLIFVFHLLAYKSQSLDPSLPKQSQRRPQELLVHLVVSQTSVRQRNRRIQLDKPINGCSILIISDRLYSSRDILVGVYIQFLVLEGDFFGGLFWGGQHMDLQNPCLKRAKESIFMKIGHKLCSFDGKKSDQVKHLRKFNIGLLRAKKGDKFICI